jgi:hypothetical protein
MSTDISARVTRDNAQIYAKLEFQIDRMSEVEAMAYSQDPKYLYDGFCWGIYDIRQNDYIVDLKNVDLVTLQAKAYQILNEPEPFDDAHMEFQCGRADRAALTRSSA